MELQLDSLQNCCKLSDLKKALSSLPKGLDETYEWIVCNIESRDQWTNAIVVMRWLCFSRRFLYLPEIVGILAIKNGLDGGFDPDERLPEPEDVMLICSSLISCHESQSRREWMKSGYRIYRFGHDNNAVRDVDEVGNEYSQVSLPKGYDIEVRFAHFSVKEYLLSDRCPLQSEFVAQNCHGLIAETTFRYLLHVGHETATDSSASEVYPLLEYAAAY